MCHKAVEWQQPLTQAGCVVQLEMESAEQKTEAARHS